MSWVAAPRDVRVTAKRSVTTPFAPADMAPVSTLSLELEKGKRGWTDFDTKVIDLTTDHLPKGLLRDREVEQTCGLSVIRKRQPVKRSVMATGPSAQYKAMRERAALLAARKAGLA
ncbi:hypothetical protein AU152_gp77 [Mycobacterium phage Phlei]|uniref:Uncharacterized protein n=1 Tax=Mycobacterium phage Phlei TaxID=1690684 RepID=A0A0N9BDP0_9CAUD|nr:hypothetical protein AU152_gp77 [Mycobacterium phage Phlei]ALA48190.1 hypothetical protein [Mycobacterium phage Phlei]